MSIDHWNDLISEDPYVVINKIRSEQLINPHENVLAILRRVLNEFNVPEGEQSIYRSDIGRLLLRYPLQK